MNFFQIQKVAAGGAFVLLGDSFLNTNTAIQVAANSRVRLLVVGHHLNDRVQADGATD